MVPLRQHGFLVALLTLCLHVLSITSISILGIFTSLADGQLLTVQQYITLESENMSNAVAALGIDKVGPRPYHFCPFAIYGSAQQNKD